MYHPLSSTRRGGLGFRETFKLTMYYRLNATPGILSFHTGYSKKTKNKNKRTERTQNNIAQVLHLPATASNVPAILHLYVCGHRSWAECVQLTSEKQRSVCDQPSRYPLRHHDCTRLGQQHLINSINWIGYSCLIKFIFLARFSLIWVL